MSASFYEEEPGLGKVYDRRLLGRLWRYIRRYRWQVVVAVVLMLGIAGLEAAGPLIVKVAIDDHIKPAAEDPEGSQALAGLGLLTLLYIGTLLGIFVLRFSQTMLMNYVGQRVMLDLRTDLFTHIQRMSMAFFDRNPVGRLVTRVTNDIAQLEQIVSFGVVQILTNLFMVSIFLVVLLYLDWRLALVMYVFIPGLWYAAKTFAAKQRDSFHDQRIWLARVNAYLNELITGVAIIQLFNRRRTSMQRFDERNRGLLEANMRFLFWYAVFEPTVVLFGAVTTAAILWYGGGRVLQDALTIGTMVAFIQYMQRFYWPIRMLSEQYSQLQSAIASTERVFSVLDEPEEIRDDEDPVPLEHVQGRIEFRDVWFAYGSSPDASGMPSDNWVLRGVSLAIEPGEKIAIVGATGAGKTTTIGLLARFYDVQRGEILVDGVPITKIRQRQLRRHVGMMLQDPYIFTDTIEENIRLRDTSISSERVRESARAVGAATFIERLPEGYQTRLAERGANLSTGQKQLIALARVAAFDPEIVLVMDEATASIDPETEAIIQRGIEQVTSGRTTLVIAHRLNTIRAVDRIVVLHHGELVEQGTHEELVARDGYYARLYELQYRLQENVTP
jgi:ATP-binding cassette subfamily B multidrug efflux pump